MKCPYCNSDLSNDYCYKCGKKVFAPGNPTLEAVTLKKKKSKVGSFFVILFLLGLFALIFFYALKTLDNEDLGNKIRDEKELISVLNDSGVPKFLSGNITDVKVNGTSSVYTVLDSLTDLYDFDNPKQEFSIVRESSEGFVFYRLQQLYNGIKVYGHELVMAVDHSGVVQSITGDYVPIKSLSNYSTLKENEISNIVKEDLVNASILSRERIIIVNGNVGLVAYLVYAYNDDGLFEYVVDADKGTILSKDSNVGNSISYKYSGSGLNKHESIYLEEFQDVKDNKVRYSFLDSSRNIEIVDGSGLNLLFSSESTPLVGDMSDGEVLIDGNQDKTLKAVYVMKELSDIYDYYYNLLGRKSFDNNGSKLSLFLNVNSDGDFYFNRLSNQIFLKDFSVDDIGKIKSLLAHEFNHAVISSSARLGENLDKVYIRTDENQSGALAEAYSDILGLIMESKSFVIGSGSSFEAIVGRDLSNPSKYDKPFVKGGDNYFPSLNGKSALKFLEDNNMESLYDFDNGGVHVNSTVVGHAAYLSFKNNAFVSREEMAKVWYNSLYMLTPTSDFEDCALAVIKTAENLGLSDKSVSIIRKAFYETNMLVGGSFKLSGVVNDGDGLMSNVKITIVSVDNPDLKFVKGSDKEGSFEFTNLSEGSYDVIFSRDGYVDVTKRIVLDKDVSLEVEMSKK